MGSTVEGTAAMLFDARTGKQMGMPSTDGTVSPSGQGSSFGWEGWGCRSAWHDGLPVITDGEVSGFVDTSRNGLIDGRAEFGLADVSSGYGTPCVAFAGNELRGTPVTNHVALWQERLWAWGMPLLGLGLVVLALWGWNRRHRNQWRRPLGHLPPIIAKPF